MSESETAALVSVTIESICEKGACWGDPPDDPFPLWQDWLGLTPEQQEVLVTLIADDGGDWGWGEGEWNRAVALVRMVA